MKCLVIRTPAHGQRRHIDCMPCAAYSCQPKLQQWVDSARRALAQALFPANCVLCGGAGNNGIDLCDGCEADLPRNQQACIVCAEPLAAASVAPRTCGGGLH